MAVGSWGLGKLSARRPNGLPAAPEKETLFGAWNHLKKTKDDCYMPAHDRLEHCAVVGYLCQTKWQQNASTWIRAAHREGCGTSPRQLSTAANASNPKEGRMSCSLSPFYRCWKGGWGALPPRRSVRAGISGCGSQLSALCTHHVSWSRFGGRFLFLSHKREKTPSSFH